MFADSNYPERRKRKSRRGEDTKPVVKEPANILYRRYVVARLYVVLSVFTSVVMSIFEPASIHHQIFDATGTGSLLVLTAIGAIAGIAFMDIIVNDLAPNKYQLKIFYDNRHILYMALSLGMYGISAAMIFTYGASAVLIRLWLDGGVAAAVAVLDIFARHRGVSWQSGTP
jgi:ABC-type Na+ efflux pump permease subunit